MGTLTLWLWLGMSVVTETFGIRCLHVNTASPHALSSSSRPPRGGCGVPPARQMIRQVTGGDGGIARSSTAGGGNLERGTSGSSQASARGYHEDDQVVPDIDAAVSQVGGAGLPRDSSGGHGSPASSAVGRSWPSSGRRRYRYSSSIPARSSWPTQGVRVTLSGGVVLRRWAVAGDEPAAPPPVPQTAPEVTGPHGEFTASMSVSRGNLERRTPGSSRASAHRNSGDYRVVPGVDVPRPEAGGAGLPRHSRGGYGSPVSSAASSSQGLQPQRFYLHMRLHPPEDFLGRPRAPVTRQPAYNLVPVLRMPGSADEEQVVPGDPVMETAFVSYRGRFSYTTRPRGWTVDMGEASVPEAPTYDREDHESESH